MQPGWVGREATTQRLIGGREGGGILEKKGDRGEIEANYPP